MGNLVRLHEQIPPAVRNRLEILLKSCADPDGALFSLRRLQEEQPGAFQRMSRSPAALQLLVAAFSHSRFLAEELLRSPEWIEPLPQSGDLHRVIAAEEYSARLEARLARYPLAEAPALELAAFRREQLLRILLRDVHGYGSLSDITEELSNLADGILECAWRRIRIDLVHRYGEPKLEDGRPCRFSILALGKLGGRELNYSSDIDLMFVYEGNGETDGQGNTNKEFFKRACIQLTEVLSAYTAHGACYRVDLRLRPEGTLGEVCISLDGAKAYYQTRARDWELQMMIKARVAAGDREPGRVLLDLVEPQTYSSTLDFSKVEAVSEARIRLHEKLARRRGNRSEFDVKLAPGGIRDIEFLVQCLQRLHGGREPWIRHASTLHALFRLRSKNHLSEIEYGRLAPAYIFLRNLEHRLQVPEDRQTHALPADEDEMEVLARRMQPSIVGSAPSAGALREQLQRHMDAVQEIYERVVHMQLPLHYQMEAPVMDPEPDRVTPAMPLESMPEAPAPISENLRRLLAQRAPGLAFTLSRSRLRYGTHAFEHYLEGILPTAEWVGWLDADPVLAGFVIDIFEHSPFFAEQLNRRPEMLEELRQMRLRPELHTRYGEMPPMLADPADLRRFYNREMLRIQCESICLYTPIFETLKHCSELADCAIATAYRMAIDQVAGSQPPVGARYQPLNQMMVVALGRLGMQEFDLASDADLVFILPDKDAEEILFWTRVAERLVQMLTAYTGDGVLFAVDTRLRPNGREGPLMQLESGYKEYFSKTAQAWEGITYMKSRMVAGSIERGTEFLGQLQDLDWRQYGQAGRSRQQLRQMRMRLEHEQGPGNPLKAGKGGYYDIDFALMYLRLKSAGIFFKVLNTPARIDIIEKMGHLDRNDARFLIDAATFYRAVDHGLRLTTGHAEGQLPGSQLQLEMLSELVGRWTPDHLHDQPLPDELEQIQSRTREFFDRLFG